MKVSEKAFTAKLTRALRDAMPSSVVFKHADRVTSGVPDVSVTWIGLTLWIEVKVIGQSGEVKDTGLQAETLSKLSEAGFALYVILDPELDGIFVVQPNLIKSYAASHIARFSSRSVKDVAEYLAKIHRNQRLYLK